MDRNQIEESTKNGIVYFERYVLLLALDTTCEHEGAQKHSNDYDGMSNQSFWSNFTRTGF